MIQVTCGNHHSLALDRNGDVFAWGLNESGQLGLGVDELSQRTPTVIQTLNCVPIRMLSAGSRHTLALSETGALYAWGENTAGQTGLKDVRKNSTPKLLSNLRNQRIVYISCGEDFSAALTSEGGLFTWGAGTYGQCGHEKRVNQFLPKKVIDLMGSEVIQISCGRCHMLIVCACGDETKIYATGLNGCGQLGLGDTDNRSLPTLLVSSKSSQTSYESMETGSSPSSPAVDCHLKKLENLHLKRIFSSRGDHSFVQMSTKIGDRLTVDQRKRTTCPISTFDNEIFLRFVNLSDYEPVPMDLIDYIDLTMSNLIACNGSYIVADMEMPAIDWNKLNEGKNLLNSIQNDRLVKLISRSLNILPAIGELSKKNTSDLDSEIYRVLFIFPMFERFFSSIDIIYKYCKFFLRAIEREHVNHILYCWFVADSNQVFCETILSIVKEAMRVLLPTARSRLPDENAIWLRSEPKAGDKQLSCFLQILKFVRENSKLSYKKFYISELPTYLDLDYEYSKWLWKNNVETPDDLYLCDYPFIFDAKAKALMLAFDSEIMQFQSSFSQHHFYDSSGFLEIHVSRDDLIQDTINELLLISISSEALRRPLKVSFVGEDAIDEGVGVKKEFFLLLLKEILDPKYGMFRFYQDTNFIWFTMSEPNTSETMDFIMYSMIGIICGLAIYNQAIINFPFPLVLYQKLLNEELSLDSLASLDPVLCKNLKAMLDEKLTEQEFDEIYGDLTFSITVENYGHPMKVNIIKDGDKEKVTINNRHEYVKRYWEFLLNESTEAGFLAFQEGFNKVMHEGILRFFNAEELMELIIGSEVHDWYELESSTIYEQPFHKDHPTVRLFWNVFHDLSQESKKKFLLFTTGSDRVPLRGMKSLELKIQAMRVSDDYLPVAHTCFNVLDLPELYTSEDKLREKLSTAIENTSGFTLA